MNDPHLGLLGLDQTVPHRLPNVYGIFDRSGSKLVSPAVFGIILEWYNRKVDSSRVTIWAPAFLILALGGVFAPIIALVLRRFPPAKLRCGGKM